MAATDPLALKVKLDLSEFMAAMNRVALTMRVAALRFQGKHALADVVERQEGRQVVREGMAHILEWLGETEEADDDRD